MATQHLRLLDGDIYTYIYMLMSVKPNSLGSARRVQLGKHPMVQAGGQVAFPQHPSIPTTSLLLGDSSGKWVHGQILVPYPMAFASHPALDIPCIQSIAFLAHTTVKN